MAKTVNVVLVNMYLQISLFYLVSLLKDCKNIYLFIYVNIFIGLDLFTSYICI